MWLILIFGLRWSDALPWALWVEFACCLVSKFVQDKFIFGIIFNVDSLPYKAALNVVIR